MDQEQNGRSFVVTRRSFIKGAGAGVAGAAVVGGSAAIDSNTEAEAQGGGQRIGPGPVRMTLNINGVNRTVEVEPRTTLINVLRGVGHRPLSPDQALTGSKVGCDRGSCGACTVMVDGKAVYGCMMLAADARGRKILTVEGLSQTGKLTAIQQQMVEKDGYQCGFCTPGFVMSLTALMRRKANPTLDEVKMAVSGNTCRCGTYPRIFEAALAAAKMNAAPARKGA